MKTIMWILAGLFYAFGGLAMCGFGLMFAHAFPIVGILCVVCELGLFILSFWALNRAQCI